MSIHQLLQIAQGPANANRTIVAPVRSRETERTNGPTDLVGVGAGVAFVSMVVRSLSDGW